MNSVLMSEQAYMSNVNADCMIKKKKQYPQSYSLAQLYFVPKTLVDIKYW